MKLNRAMRLFTVLAVMGIFATELAYGCTRCFAARACLPGLYGGCSCTIAGRDCRTFGKCVRGKCIPGSASQDVIRVRPSQHPWLSSRTIVDDIRIYSPELAEVVAAERADIASRVGWYFECRNEVGGPVGANGEIGFKVTRDGPKWTFQVLPGEPTLAQRLDERPEVSSQTLEVDETTWTIKHGEEVWAQGTIR